MQQYFILHNISLRFCKSQKQKWIRVTIIFTYKWDREWERERALDICPRPKMCFFEFEQNEPFVRWLSMVLPRLYPIVHRLQQSSAIYNKIKCLWQMVIRSKRTLFLLLLLLLLFCSCRFPFDSRGPHLLLARMGHPEPDPTGHKKRKHRKLFACTTILYEFKHIHIIAIYYSSHDLFQKLLVTTHHHRGQYGFYSFIMASSAPDIGSVCSSRAIAWSAHG